MFRNVEGEASAKEEDRSGSACLDGRLLNVLKRGDPNNYPKSAHIRFSRKGKSWNVGSVQLTGTPRLDHDAGSAVF